MKLAEPVRAGTAVAVKGDTPPDGTGLLPGLPALGDEEETLQAVPPRPRRRRSPAERAERAERAAAGQPRRRRPVEGERSSGAEAPDERGTAPRPRKPGEKPEVVGVRKRRLAPGEVDRVDRPGPHRPATPTPAAGGNRPPRGEKRPAADIEKRSAGRRNPKSTSVPATAKATLSEVPDKKRTATGPGTKSAGPATKTATATAAKRQGAHTKKKSRTAATTLGVLVAVAVLAAGGVGWLYFGRSNTEVRMGSQVAGVRLGDSGLTVQEIIDKTGLKPKSAAMVSAKSRKPIPGMEVGPSVTVNGAKADLTSRVMPGQKVELADATDGVEPLVAKKAYIPVPPDQAMPTVISHMYKPGRAGQVDVMVGQYSNEEVERKLIAPPMAAQKVTEKVVALTFDDGPSPFTPHFLEILKQKGVKGTFCTIGTEATANPAMLQRIAAEGHELCNHTMTHDVNLPRRDEAKVKSEIDLGRAAIRKAGLDTAWYRPPGGALGANVQNHAYQNGEITIWWAVDTNDWRKPGADKITAAVHSQTGPGAIILMHDGGGDRTQTLAALPGIIDWLKAEGYEIVPMGWMLQQHSTQPAKYDEKTPAVDANPDGVFQLNKPLPTSGGMAPTATAKDQLPGAGKPPAVIAQPAAAPDPNAAAAGPATTVPGGERGM